MQVGNAIGRGNRHLFLAFLWLELGAVLVSLILAVVRIHAGVTAAGVRVWLAAAGLGCGWPWDILQASARCCRPHRCHEPRFVFASAAESHTASWPSCAHMNTHIPTPLPSTRRARRAT